MRFRETIYTNIEADSYWPLMRFAAALVKIYPVQVRFTWSIIFQYDFE